MATASSVPLAQVAALNPRLLKTLSDQTPISFVPMAAVSAEEAMVTSPMERPYVEVRKGVYVLRKWRRLGGQDHAVF